jgi:hypothetical protein
MGVLCGVALRQIVTVSEFQAVSRWSSFLSQTTAKITLSPAWVVKQKTALPILTSER